MVHTVCICGAGTMGTGIAQVFARAGYYTILYDVNKVVLEKATVHVAVELQKAVDRQKMTLTEKEKISQQLFFTSDLHHCIGDVIIEAVVEKLEVKISLFNQLAELNHRETVFATNTSSLSVTKIAESVLNPARVIGMHFFNPAPLMQLVEIVRTKFTNAETIELISSLAAQAGKTSVICNDVPGFIVNRVARPYYLEALRMLEQNSATISGIDLLMESCGFKMGPFKLMDLIGNDINYAASQSVYDELGQPGRLKPSIIQQAMVKKSELGRKSGRGYYPY